MTSKNDITGDSIRTKVKGGDSKKYADNWEKIFGKKKNSEKPEDNSVDKKGK
jgi:hypothetical protein